MRKNKLYFSTIRKLRKEVVGKWTQEKKSQTGLNAESKNHDIQIVFNIQRKEPAQWILL